MKNLFFFVLLFVSSLSFAQTLEKSQSIAIYDIVPTVAPCQYCSERAYVRADSTEYRWQTTPPGWIKWYDGNSYDTRLQEDSILVRYNNGVEVSRDTLSTNNSGGSGIYSGSGNVPNTTTATISDNGVFKLQSNVARLNFDDDFAELSSGASGSKWGVTVVPGSFIVGDLEGAGGTLDIDGNLVKSKGSEFSVEDLASNTLLRVNSTNITFPNILNAASLATDGFGNLVAGTGTGPVPTISQVLNSGDDAGGGFLNNLQLLTWGDGTSPTPVYFYDDAGQLKLGKSGQASDLFEFSELYDTDISVVTKQRLVAPLDSLRALYDSLVVLNTSIDAAAVTQVLSISGQDLSLSGGGGTVVIPSGGSGSVTLPQNQIAYGDASNQVSSDTDFQRTATGLILEGVTIGVGDGNNSIVFGNTTANSSGADWIANGAFAGSNNTTGSSWIAQGTNAGLSSTSGSFWIAQGRDAGRSNTTGSNWIAQGPNSGYNNITGINWIAQGANAAFSNLSGSNWIAQGRDAGRSNTTGSDWIAKGRDAGRSNTTGNSWVAIGRDAARNNQSGSSFFASGINAGYNNTSGSNWVAIGPNSSYNNQSGSEFIAIGKDAARQYSGGTTSATNFTEGVYIGSGTKVGGSGTTNEIVIGHDAEGNGSNTATIGSTSIIGTYLSSLRVRGNTTASRPVAGAGYLGYNTTTDGFEGHNGTSFLRFMQQSDVEPINGQIGVWNSTTNLYEPTTLTSGGTMSTFSINGDTGTASSIADGNLVTIAGGTGLSTTQSNGTVTVDIAQSEVNVKATAEPDQFLLIYDAADAQSWNLDIDLLAQYANDQLPLESPTTYLRQTQQTGFGVAAGFTNLAPAATTQGILRFDTSEDELVISNNNEYETIQTSRHLDAMYDQIHMDGVSLSLATIARHQTVMMNRDSGDGANNTLTIPQGSTNYANNEITIISRDFASGASNVINFSGTAAQDGASTITTLTAGNFETITVRCVPYTSPAAYRWVITNRY